MNPIGAFVIYILIWWCVFFAMLPLGIQSRWEEEGDGVEGADPGAPLNPNLKKKVLWTTLAALALWAPTIVLILSGVINFRD